MKNLLAAFCCCLTLCGYSQSYTISGYIQDSSTGENLIGATIYEPNLKQGTTSNLYGFYSLTLPTGTTKLSVSYVGYNTMEIELDLTKNTTYNFKLSTDFLLEEVVISAEQELAQQNQMSAVDLSIKQIKELPAFLGEVDILKTIQLLPGIQSGSEGSSGLYVRGGGPDQNLILLDGVPVYNASHLFGFFSVFNADAINNVNVIKGGFPARYGGRLSSVIDISMKEGNNQEFHGEGSIGLISSKLTLEGPIKSEKTSFIISGRRTYIDLLTRPLIQANTEGDETFGYYFYDLNAKVNHRFSEKDRLFVSSYLGRDNAYARIDDTWFNGSEEYQYKEESGLDWGNATTAIRWNHVYSPKLFGNLTATYSSFNFDIFSKLEDTYPQGDEIITDKQSIKYLSGIQDIGLKADFDYDPAPNHKIKTGVNLTYHKFKPGALSLKETFSSDTTLGANATKAFEYFTYIEDDYKISAKLKLNLGLHYSGFLVENEMYHSIQPRLSARYMLNNTTSIKGSVVRMTQFIHLLTNAGIGLPTDLWVPTTDQVKPQQAWQAAIGAAKNLSHGYEVSAEAYYKTMNNLIEYREGATYLNTTDSWEDKIVFGDGESYGLELFLNKKVGKVTGWIGYTWSKTYRTFEAFNDGKPFPYKFDRRHDLAITTACKISKNLSISGAWVFGTGNAISLPEGRYKRFNTDSFWAGEVERFNGRNSFRMRDYHRLDLSVSRTKKKRWGEVTWSFGTYNTYSRANAFYMDVAYTRNGDKKFVQYSVFPIIPFLRYSFKF